MLLFTKLSSYKKTHSVIKHLITFIIIYLNNHRIVNNHQYYNHISSLISSFFVLALKLISFRFIAEFKAINKKEILNKLNLMLINCDINNKTFEN